MSIKIFFSFKFYNPTNLFLKTLVLKDRKREPEIVNKAQVLVKRARNGEIAVFREFDEHYKKMEKIFLTSKPLQKRMKINLIGV
jgi:hypothetical protein